MAFALARNNAKDVSAIEGVIGPADTVKIEPHIYAICSTFESYGAAGVLRKCAPNVKALLEILGPEKVALIMPCAANIIETLQASNTPPQSAS